MMMRINQNKITYWRDKAMIGDCSFLVAGSRLRNSLPPDVTSAPTLTVFRKRLKLVFSGSFPS